MNEPLLRAAEMRDAEARAIAGGVPGLVLMERAGRAAAALAASLAEPGGRVMVLCGPGNNGGDGYVVARHLRARGFRVEAVALSAPRGDAATAASAWGGPTLSPDRALFEGTALVVDAMFGTGLGRDLDGEAADLVRRANASGRPILALDIPSGIDADSGLVRGAAIEASSTVTFASRKPGHLLQPGRRHCGRLHMVDIGLPIPQHAPVAANSPALWSGRLPKLLEAGHKYDRGHALVVSGGPAHTGAARLAARGALRAGAGLVSVATSRAALATNAVHLTAIMLRICDDPGALTTILSDRRFNALALGPALGVGVETRRWIEAALAADRATVLDADALTSFAGDFTAFSALTRTGRRTPVVLTPHDGEFKRLFAGEGEASTSARGIAAEPSKLERTLKAAAATGAVVILKGPDTVIAAPDGRAAINGNGSPHLATAGSGDVLGGIVAGLLAQNMPGYEAACAAVWIHADAAARFGPGLIAEDLPEMIPAVLLQLYEGDRLTLKRS